MARTTKAQKAGMDFLDLVLFNELVVEHGMDAVELRQLDTVIERVTEMAEDRYSGREAEIIKHVAYHFLELTLANSTEEFRHACQIKVPPLDLASEMIEAVESYNRSYQMAFMHVITEMSTGVDASYAWEIAETLREEFLGCSALVRRDLLKRCFVREFREVSVDVYCWLIVAGVLPVTKNRPDRIRREFDTRLKIRLILLADYEMITHHLSMCISKDGSVLVFLENPKFNLKEATVERLLDIQKHFIDAVAKPSLRGIPLLHLRDLASNEQVQDFFEQWGSRKVRFRMHGGTLASWLGVLGAFMVCQERMRHAVNAVQKKYPNGTGSVCISDLKIPAIYNEFCNKGTVTEIVTKRLSECGLRVGPRTLYCAHAEMENITLKLLREYCKKTRQAGIAMPSSCEDIFYRLTFIHAGKLKS
ncbi:hypothetical protein APA86_24985 [Pseudomonas aeruginosa]|uniref:hypothetical protein n=1 Tax=Pseudomonas aeruginosa TaxID=287 RepID=UPI00071BC068|nr:hypothetical protein [Pseudomonas aeruginosa]KSN53107.1 hypothetical protein APA86_24985 [Pseudomonas aeruginosa]MBF3174435.1 hypothetical protein [Pseudomonas aeruginosa]